MGIDLNLIQDILIYFTLLYLTILAYNSWKGVRNIRLFEKKYLVRVRFIVFITWINLLINLIFEADENRKIMGSWLLLAAAIVVTFGLLRIKNNMIQGKKYRILFQSSLFGLVLMVAWTMIFRVYI